MSAKMCIRDSLWEGRDSPIWPDGTQHSRNVYAHTREGCEEKLKALITEMNEERKNLKEQLAGIAPPEKLTKKQRKLWDYMRCLLYTSTPPSMTRAIIPMST